MIGFRTGLAALLGMSLMAVACTPPEPVGRRAGSGSERGDDDEEDDSEPSGSSSKTGKTRSASTTSGDSAESKPAETPQVRVSFGAATKQNFNGLAIARVCSDRGADHSEATFIDASSIKIVEAGKPDRVLATISGAEFQALKQQVLKDGELTFPVLNPDGLPAAAGTEFALIAGGDSRFATPADCGVSLVPGSNKERDVEEFPNNNTMIFNTKMGGSGCGIVGYIEVYYDKGNGKVYSRATSQLLIAADDEGRAGFPANASNPACDGHDSPLVLDLQNRGVALSSPIRNVFDVDGDGTLDDSPWVVSDETPFLVLDRNGNGVVDGVDEMFGNRTRGPDGQRTSANGFEALAAWDGANGSADGVIDGKDKVWASLRLWFDRNHDGVTDPGEIETLEANGVQSISLAFVPVKENLLSSTTRRVEGAVRQRGGATMTDGRVVNVVDVWFQRRF